MKEYLITIVTDKEPIRFLLHEHENKQTVESIHFYDMLKKLVGRKIRRVIIYNCKGIDCTEKLAEIREG